MAVENARVLFTRGDAGPVAKQASGVLTGGNLTAGLSTKAHPHRVIPVFPA